MFHHLRINLNIDWNRTLNINGENLKPNHYYYVKTENRFPFTQSSWYSYNFLSKVFKEYKHLKKEIKITHKIKCSLKQKSET